MIWKRAVNLTPHVVRVRRFDGSEVEVAPTLPSARVAMSKPDGIHSSALGVPVFNCPEWGAVEGLPDPEPGTLYIVSALCALAVTDRDDVVSPATGPTDGCVRDSAGQVWAVTRFISAKKGVVGISDTPCPAEEAK